MTDPTRSPDAVTDAIDTTASAANSAIDRAAAAGAGLVDTAADAAKSAERGVRAGGRAALEAGQDAVRAGLGAAGALGEQASKLLSTLVDRGAQLEHKVVEQVKSTASTAGSAVTHRVSDVRTAVGTRAEAAGERVGDAIEGAVAGPLAGAMRRVGVPTRAEVQELSSAVAALAAKVDALVSRLDAAPVVFAAEEAVIVTPEGGPVDLAAEAGEAAVTESASAKRARR